MRVRIPSIARAQLCAFAEYIPFVIYCYCWYYDYYYQAITAAIAMKPPRSIHRFPKRKRSVKAKQSRTTTTITDHDDYNNNNNGGSSSSGSNSMDYEPIAMNNPKRKLDNATTYSCGGMRRKAPKLSALIVEIDMCEARAIMEAMTLG